MIIYKLTSPSNKSYIGQAKSSLELRIKQHLQLYNKLKRNNSKYRNHNVKLFYALDKYEFPLWKSEILEYCSSREELDEREIYYISLFDTVKNGYNVSKGGSGRNVDKLDDEHKKNISESRKNYFNTKEGKEWKEILRKNAHKNMPKFTSEQISENNSKYYLIKIPDGEYEIVKNLLKYCEDKKLIHSSMVEMMSKNKNRNRIYSHKNYRILKLPDNYSDLSEQEKELVVSELKTKFIPIKIKSWEVIDPNGNKYLTYSLKEFCENKGLTKQCLGAVALGKSESHKGWKCKQIITYIE